MTPEGRIKAKVKRELAALAAHGFKVYHFMPVQNGMGAPALDFFCSINGRFVAIETKAKGKIPTLTPRQTTTAKQITDSGAQVYVIGRDTDWVAVKDAIRKSCGPTQHSKHATVLTSKGCE